MAIRGLPVEQAKALKGEARFEAFCEYAGYFEDATRLPYAIRVGSKTLFAADTYELREKFYKEITRLKRTKS